MCTCMYWGAMCSITFLLQEMNDEEIVDSVDFSEFEALFQVKRFKKQRKKKDTGKLYVLSDG